MNSSEIERIIWQVVHEALEIGPGYAQEGYVIRTTWEKLGSPHDLKLEQNILDVWYRLVREGQIVWGYDVSNPGAPFFHKPVS
jgi:hypothetical protein